MGATGAAAYALVCAARRDAVTTTCGYFPPLNVRRRRPEELGVPGISFRAASACSFLAYLTAPELFEHGDLPFPGGGGLDEPVRRARRSGLESFLRRRDLPRLEAAVEGVPTVCWPCNVDQQTNSRLVGAVWGTGLDWTRRTCATGPS
ncbi:hypothetical protein C2845_PM03G06800 [Panicum miliaceum]|uniref:Uncharacterized protein n=1 Tax=Panicum miliaceum TaxID=4540 RepID=A0A3L6T7C9_PANMI|nr:hypothetical protein C2845_PM03G06800 [Panicum miliaceum]